MDSTDQEMEMRKRVHVQLEQRWRANVLAHFRGSQGGWMNKAYLPYAIQCCTAGALAFAIGVKLSPARGILVGLLLKTLFPETGERERFGKWKGEHYLLPPNKGEWSEWQTRKYMRNLMSEVRPVMNHIYNLQFGWNEYCGYWETKTERTEALEKSAHELDVLWMKMLQYPEAGVTKDEVFSML